MGSDKKIKLDVVSGFLGAGKTTFIQKLVQDIYDKENIVVLENEFGKISLDGATLARQGIAVESICAGCICCTGAGELLQNVNSIVDKYHPERIVIEPTGVALLSDIRELLAEPCIADRCEVDYLITIVDAKNFDHRMMISKDFFENQIRNSKVIFLSKTDTLATDRIDEIAQQVTETHPGCTVIAQPWQVISADRLKALISRNPEELPHKQHPHIENHTHSEHHHNHAGGFESFTYEADTPADHDKVNEFLKNASKGSYGEIHRMKGVFQDSKTGWFCFEYVPGEFQMIPITQEMPRDSKKLQVCVIGTKLKKDLLQKQIF
jgi:G3E family GTPase